MSEIKKGIVVIIDDSHAVKKEYHSGCRGIVTKIMGDFDYYIVKLTQCNGPHKCQEGQEIICTISALKVVEEEFSSYLTDEDSNFYDD